MCPSRPLSKTDNNEGNEMHYLNQPRGPGKSFVFRMATPSSLIGRMSPFTGKPFGAEIKLGTGTRRLPEARKKRDYYLGKVRELEAAMGADSRFSLERAEGWAAEIAKQEANGDGGPDDFDVRSVLKDEMERARSLPRTMRPPKGTLERFEKVALRTGYPIDEAVTRYIEERKVGNRQGLKPLSKTTVNDVRTAVSYMKKFCDGGEGLCLQDIDRKEAQRFRYEFEPPRVCRQLYSIVGFVTKIGAGCKHGVENCEELAGGGGYGCFDGFSGTLQAIAKGLEGIAPSGSV